MNKVLHIALLILLTSSLWGQQIIQTIEFDGTDQITFIPITPLFPCDGTPGTFGIENGAFVISDTEGFPCCSCGFMGALPECGPNNETATSIPIPGTQLYCDIIVEAEVSARGGGLTMECANNPGSDPTGSCLPAVDPGKDAMKIEIRLDGVVHELGSYCGNQRNGNFRLDNLNGDFMVIEITGGAQDPDEAYEIERIVISGTPSQQGPHVISSPNPAPCANDIDPTQSIVLVANGGGGSASFNWELDGNPLPDIGRTLIRTAPIAFSDAGLYAVTITDPGNSCMDIELEFPLTVQNCSPDTATFTGLQTTFCRDLDTLALPANSDEGFTGTWDVPRNLVLSSVPIFDQITFTPDQNTGAAARTIDIRIDTIRPLGNFPPGILELCFFDEPGITYDFVTELGLVVNDIDNVESFGMNFFDPANELNNINVSNISAGAYEMIFTSVPFGACKQLTDTVDITISKIDRGSDASFVHCAMDPDPIDFVALVTAANIPSGRWEDVDNSGVDLTQPTQVDVAALVPGMYEYLYIVGGTFGCPDLSDTATLTIEILPGSSMNANLIAPGNLCEGDGFSIVVDGESFDESNPTGDRILIGQAANGCDSMVSVNLVFNESKFADIFYDGCQGDGFNVIVNGTTYNEANPFGDQTFSAVNGCDSTVTIDLIYKIQGARLINPPDLCQGNGYSVTINGNTYDEANPSGVEMVPTPNQCDSIITIDLNFSPVRSSMEVYDGCSGDNYSVVVNGITYDEQQPSGTEMLLTSSGCDSIVTINLIYKSTGAGEELFDGCEGDNYNVTVNGTLYDASNPSGTEILSSLNGCDSTVSIALLFKPNKTGEENYVGKAGDGYSVIVGGTTYDESNPTGSEILSSSDGCDSTVSINLLFIEGRIGTETYTGCTGDGYEVQVGNSIYNESNPSGIDSLLTMDNIDSVVTTTLTFLSPSVLDISETHTSGSGFSIILNGINYNETNPSGTETITNGASSGCDSIITVNLNFVNAFITTIDTTVCSGDGYSRMVGSSLYDENNPSGRDTFMTSDGIDSFVMTTLTFEGPSQFSFSDSRCNGDGFEFLVGTSIYNEVNPSGIDTLAGANMNGCDSIVTVSLVYSGDVVISNNLTVCPGESIAVGNSVYDAMNPSGVDTLMAGTGCDTIITTQLLVDSINVDICAMASCMDETTGSLIIYNLESTGMLTVSLEGQDYNLTDSLTIPGLAAGNYNLTISNAVNCMISESIVIEELEDRQLDIQSSQIGMDSLMFDIVFDGIIDNVIWDADQGTVCSSCNPLIVDGTNPNLFTLTLIDDRGCTYTAAIQVGDIPGGEPEPPSYYVSNAFIRSGAAGNQMFFLQTGDPGIVNYDLSVYSRWGSLVFDQLNLVPNDNTSGWNGELRGQPVESGVYIYKLVIRQTDGSTTVDAGDILFVR